MNGLLRVALAVVITGAIAFALHASEVGAELDNQVFTSKPDGIRIVVPRYWRATDQPSYPGVLLWMMRSDPDGRIALSAEAFTHELYCSWPVTCRASRDASIATKYACALRQRLQGENMKLGAVQAGPRDNELAGMASVWFEYDDGKHYLRQAVAIANDRAVSLVLSAGTVDARASLARPFDQALRTLRPLTAAEAAGSDAAGSAGSAGSNGSASGSASASPSDAGAAPADGGVALDAGVGFASAPAPHVPVIGPCN